MILKKFKYKCVNSTNDVAIGLIKTKNSLKSLGINTVNELNKLNRY